MEHFEHTETEVEEFSLTRIPPEKVEQVLPEIDALLDIREPEDFKQGHIKGAINIPKAMLAFKLGEIPHLDSPDAKIIMYCKEGKRCASAALSLIKMGYKNVYSLEGGLDAWVAAGKPIVT